MVFWFVRLLGYSSQIYDQTLINLGVVMKDFVDVIKVHNQQMADFRENDYPI